MELELPLILFTIAFVCLLVVFTCSFISMKSEKANGKVLLTIILIAGTIGIVFGLWAVIIM